MEMAKADMKNWIELGKQSKRVQEELGLLLTTANKTKLPKTITKHIGTCFTGIQKFKMYAENRMFSDNPKLDDEALEIFYGDDKKEKLKK